MALAGGIRGAGLPDNYTVQFHSDTDSDLLIAQAVLALSAKD
jgi:hypothetical protein